MNREAYTEFINLIKIQPAQFMPRKRIYRFSSTKQDGWTIYNNLKKLWLYTCGNENTWKDFPVHVYGNKVEIDIL